MRRLALVALLALVLPAAAGAATTRLDRQGTVVQDGRKVFPLVLAKGPPAAGFGRVAAAGVTALKVGPPGAWTDEDVAATIEANRAAAAAGLTTWVNLSAFGSVRPGNAAEWALRDVVGSLTGDPSAAAISLWKGADEPQRYRIGSARLRFPYCLLTGRGDRRWCAGRRPVDRSRLLVTVQAPRAGVWSLRPYSAVSDVHGVNSYPVAIGDPDPRLDEVGAWTNVLRLATPNRAVWTTLQICWSWSYDAAGNVVLPTLEQERFMVYDAILSGARALAFYGGQNPKCWGQLDQAGGWNWTFWGRVLEPLVREIGASSPLAPALVSPGSTRVLRTSDLASRAISRRGTGGDLWVIAVKGGSDGGPVTIAGLPDWARSASVYGEGREVTAAGGALTDGFERWGVHVYRFRKPAATLLGVASCPANVANGLRTVGSARQLITVQAARYRTTWASLRLWRRQGDCWVEAGGPWTARVGWNGLSDSRREGDGTTPTGVYPIGRTMYGNDANPGVRYRYRRLRCGDWWNEDPRSSTYNSFQHVPCGTRLPFRTTTPGLWEERMVYRHLAVIDYNMRPVVPGRGSGIFLHVERKPRTNGCVSIPYARLVSTLRWLDPTKRPLIAIGTVQTFRRL
ncbi:MAG TPA: L,D-transpeptidase family protein [Gaiellaceae bacterium]|nr:L,D-transpeptidase family protein [Gaiellaceae bacterium]